MTEPKVKKRPGATLEPQTVAGVPQPEKGTTIASTIIQWVFILGILTGLYFLGKFLSVHMPALHLQAYQIVVLSFSCGFTWVYVFKFGSVKPFNCATCMSGWFALIFGYWVHGWIGFLFMPLAMTVAALYSEIRLRYL